MHAPGKRRRQEARGREAGKTGRANAHDVPRVSCSCLQPATDAAARAPLFAQRVPVRVLAKRFLCRCVSGGHRVSPLTHTPHRDIVRDRQLTAHRRVIDRLPLLLSVMHCDLRRGADFVSLVAPAAVCLSDCLTVCSSKLFSHSDERERDSG